MKEILRKFIRAVLCAGMVLGMAACATDGGSTATSAQAEKPKAKPVPSGTTPFYAMVYTKEGRIWSFGNSKDYLMYLKNGEVTLTRTRIGVGPNRETVIFGITGDDVNKNQPSIGEQVFDGHLVGGSEFYGEVVKGGRFYVFGEWQDFQDYLTHGEMIYTFAEIGTGPKGESVIYALNKVSTKKGRPVGLIEKFQALHGIKK